MKRTAFFISAAMAAGLGAGQAAAAINITKATIASGRLIVEGTSTTGTQISLDGKATANIGANRVFKFSTLYRPSTCRIKLSVVGSPATFKNALVSNCGPAGLTPRGAWSSTTAYAPNDLVTNAGSSWRAKTAVTAGGVPPVDGALWELFAAAGSVAGIETVAGTASDDIMDERTVTATCPSGKQVVGGGYVTSNISSAPDIIIIASYPSSATVWTVTGTSYPAGLDESYSLQAYAICVTP